MEMEENLLEITQKRALEAIQQGNFNRLTAALSKNSGVIVKPFATLTTFDGLTRSHFMAEDTTLLHEAVAWQRLDMVTWLIEQGAPINAQDRNGCTPLHRAVSHESDDIRQLLVAKGADQSIQDSNGLTPMQLLDGLIYASQDQEGIQEASSTSPENLATDASQSHENDPAIISYDAFMQAIKPIQEKKEACKELSVTNPFSYRFLAEKLAECVERLHEQYRIYRESKKLLEFRDACIGIIKAVLPLAEQHRGYKEIFWNVLYGVGTLGLYPTYNFFSTRYFFFHVPTDSETKLRTARQNIEQLTVTRVDQPSEEKAAPAMMDP